MRLLNTLYLTEPALRVAARQSSLEVRQDRSLVARFPLEGLEAIIMGPRIEITTHAVARCVEHGIRVALLEHSGKLRYSVQGPTRGNVALRVAQLRAADNPIAASHLAMSFVGGKLQNQRRLLQRWASDTPGTFINTLQTAQRAVERELQKVPAARDGDHLRGIEGNATRAYFKGLGAHIHRVVPQLAFTTRTRRPPLDPINALLSYCYGLALSEATGALDAVGLDPQIGYLHLLRPGRASLALDLIEEVRPVLDRFAIRLLALRTLRPEHFETLANKAIRLTNEGRRTLLDNYEQHRNDEISHGYLDRQIPRASLLPIQATLLARTIRGDLDRYPPFIMTP